jgi:hypothetical protein
MLKAIITSVLSGFSKVLRGMMPRYMKRAKLLLLALLVSFAALYVAPVQRVHADAADEAALSSVEDELTLLWDYVDNNADKPDAEFYPVFVGLADETLAEVDKAEKQLAKTKETRGTKEAVERLREDIQQIQIGLFAWRESAASNDSAGFEDASYFLQGVVEIYNEDVEKYNHSAYGTQAVMTFLAYTIPLATSLAICAFLFAWATLRNDHSQDIVAEIQRKLRWHMALAMLAPIVAGSVLLYLFFFTAVTLMWAWIGFGVSLVPLAYEIVRYVRVSMAAAKQP